MCPFISVSLIHAKHPFPFCYFTVILININLAQRVSVCNLLCWALRPFATRLKFYTWKSCKYWHCVAMKILETHMSSCNGIHVGGWIPVRTFSNISRMNTSLLFVCCVKVKVKNNLLKSRLATFQRQLHMRSINAVVFCEDELDTLHGLLRPNYLVCQPVVLKSALEPV